MNMPAASGFIDNLKNVFADWTIALLLFFAVLLVLAALFKGPKVVLLILITATVIAGGCFLAAFIAMLATWDVLRLIDFAIKWVPTVIFALIVIFSAFRGARRGLRKSLILLANAVVAAAICIAFFYFCASSKWVDKTLLSLINGVMGGNTLQNMLGVSAECTTIREIAAEYLPKIIGGDVGLLLADNPEYIVTLADMAFRIVFGIITILLYFVLVFLFYLVYLIAYPERRHKKKVNLAFEQNETDRPYIKNRKGGIIVGVLRGITAGLISLSFIGSAFFIAAGGKGNGTLGKYDLENDEYNTYFAVYRSIESYGTTGIFKILNLMTDPSDTPFYLFAADMVLSGNLDSEESDVASRNVKFREELANFTGFAKDALNLLLKYGKDEITPIINGNGGEDAFDTIVKVMNQPEFRTEFDGLIDAFDSDTYVINLGMSLVNSIVNTIDDLSFASSISEDNKELMKILFQKGYLSDVIPDEHALKDEIATGTSILSEDRDRPRLNVRHLINKKDVRLILDVALSFLADRNNTDGEEEAVDALNLVETLLPDLGKLSILGTSRADEIDPVLTRLYCYVENKYLTAEGEEGVTYKSIADEKVEWLDEINVLLDVTKDALGLWKNIYAAVSDTDENAGSNVNSAAAMSETDGTEEGGSTEEGGGTAENPLDAVGMVLAIFDKDSPNHDENIQYFDNIRGALENSRIIGMALSTSYIYHTITDALSSAFASDVGGEEGEESEGGIYVPEDLVYTGKVNADGSVTPGEMHYLLGGFRLFCSVSYGLVKDLLAGETKIDIDILDDLAAVLGEKDKDGASLSEYLTGSYFLRSFLSDALIEKLRNETTGEEYVYIPTASLEKSADGTPVNVINEADFRSLLDNFKLINEFVKPLVDNKQENEGEGDGKTAVDTLEFIEKKLDDGTFLNLVKSNRIFEATVAKHLWKYISTNNEIRERIDFPSTLDDVESWVTTIDAYGRATKGELCKLLDALTVDGLDFKKLFKGEGNLSAANFIELLGNAENAKKILESDILRYTISKYLIDMAGDEAAGEETDSKIPIIVPYVARENTPQNSSMKYVVKKSELLRLVSAFNNLGIDLSNLDSSNLNLSDILTKLVANKTEIVANPILSATLIHMIVNNENAKELRDLMEIPTKYSEAGSALTDYGSGNPWTAEFPRFIDALDEMFGISTSEEKFEFDAEKIKDTLSKLIPHLNDKSIIKPDSDLTRLQVCYLSDIARSAITKVVDEAFSENEFVAGCQAAKSHGYYRQEELQKIVDVLSLPIPELKDLDLTNGKEVLETLEDIIDTPLPGGGGTLRDLFSDSDILSGLLQSLPQFP